VKKYVLIPLLIFPVMIFASSNSAFLALYNSGLNQQMPAYQSATIQLVQAQNALYSLTSIFVMPIKLGTADFMVHHIHAFTIHVTTLIY
jgi:hypothetical protein